VDEGCFVALRWEVAQYRARLLALLRHAVASLHRVAAVSAAALTRLSREVSATALAEGACVEAFAQLCGEALARPAPGPLALSVTFGYTRGDQEDDGEGEGVSEGSGGEAAWRSEVQKGAGHASWVIDPSSSSSAGAAAGGLSLSPAFTSTSATAHAGPVLLIQALTDSAQPGPLPSQTQQHADAADDASAADAAANPDALAASLAAEANPTNASLLAAIDAAVAETGGNGEGAAAAATAAKARALRVIQAALPLVAPSSLLALSRTLTSAALRHGYATSPAEEASSASASASGAARYSPSALPLRVALAEVQQLAVSGALQPLPAAAALAHTASLRALLLLHALPKRIRPTAGGAEAAGESKDGSDGDEEEEGGASAAVPAAGAGAAASARDGELCIDWRRLLLSLLMGGPGQPALRPLLQRALAGAAAAEAGPAEGGSLTPRAGRSAVAAAAERVLLAAPALGDGSAVAAAPIVPGVAAPPSPHDIRRLLDALLACSSACAAAGLLPQTQALGPALASRTLVPLHAAVTHAPLWFSPAAAAAAASAGDTAAAGSIRASNGKPSLVHEADDTPARAAAARRYQPPPSPAAAAAACLPLPGSRRNSLSLLEPVALAVPLQGADPLPAPADVAAVAGAGALAQELALASALRQGSVARSRAAAGSGERQIAEALMLPFAVAVPQAAAQPLDGHGPGHGMGQQLRRQNEGATAAAGEAFFVDVDELCDALQAAAGSGL
jgi:hypothetical protein